MNLGAFLSASVGLQRGADVPSPSMSLQTMWLLRKILETPTEN